MDDTYAVLEGLLFLSGDEGLTLAQLSDVLEMENDETERWLEKNSTRETQSPLTVLQVIFMTESFLLLTLQLPASLKELWHGPISTGF